MKTKNIHIAEEDTALPSSEEEEEDLTLLQDEDIINNADQTFPVCYKISDESVVSLKKDYVLSLCSDSAFTRVAAGLSNGSVQIFDIDDKYGLKHATTDCLLPPPAAIGSTTPINICGVRFLDETSNCLLVATTNGLVRLFDLRTNGNKEQARFEEENLEMSHNFVRKTITCFDRNANGRILCTGTEDYHNNVYLLFYDVRERKQLGGYFESHQDDVTALKFHSQNPDLLCTGSTDGLINIFDIKEASEDDALLTTINTESSVHKLSWHKNLYEKDIISCITHTNDLKLYECDEGDLIAEFERSEITAAMKRKNPANCNVIDAHNMTDGEVFLLSGTNYNKGEILRSLRLQNKQFLPLANFDGNKQIVRASVYDAKSNAVVTAGESGIVSLWIPQTDDQQTLTSSSSKLKSKTSKPKKKTPY